ncbi:hypothetical protein VTL71DRAFT_13205 [Oculimacula yallundae]|uniref:Heterokaryon incompatibility domain-containing protein n=1 Tax=Oculimacula yallundae TaxID=86028 RepID=A0ABR4CJN5_9HELO
MELQNSSVKKDLLQGQNRSGKLREIGQSSSHSYPKLCHACQCFWRQPLERLGPTLVLGGERYDLWNVCGPRTAAQDIRTSIDFGCRICSLYWENVSCTILPDGSKVVDQAEHTVRYYLEWDKILLRFQNFGVGRWPQESTHFRLLSEQASSLPEGCEQDVSMISENTAGEDCWKFLSEKFRTCITTHKHCTAYSEGKRWFPTRLIDISNHKLIHLVNKHVPRLTSENITSWLNYIPSDNLTKTFRDAINVARRLDSHYLWIDSLCIIQDCSEDWERESASMGEVYRRCICNISATVASDGSDSLFVERNPYSIPKFMVEIGWSHHRTSYSFARSDIWELGVINSNLNRRGWVIQERLLSPRTISFGSQIFWECHELEACETWPDGLPAGLSLQGECSDVWNLNVLGPKSWLRIIKRPFQSSDDPYRVWKTIVHLTITALQAGPGPLSKAELTSPG